jgi:hypothetical protein
METANNSRNMKKISRFISLFMLVIPFFASAQVIPPAQLPAGNGINLNVIQPYATGIINVINSIFVPVLIAVAFIVFLWGVYKYFILGADSDTERATGRQFVLWGIIGFVIIFSLWGLVNIVGGTLGFSFTTPAPKPPRI